MQILMLILKAVSGLTALFFLTKLLGRKQMGQLNIYDYIIGISIGNIVAEMSVNKEVPFLDGLIVLITYTIVAILATYITTKSIKMRRFMTGGPLVIIENGIIIEKFLNKSRLDVNDLLEEARTNGYFDLSEIEYAIMEANGRISFLPKSKFMPLTSNDMKKKTTYKGLSSNLIIDGNIMKEHLKYINKDEKWLRTRLKNLGYVDISNILLAICDSNEVITIYLKYINKRESDCLE